MLVAAWRYDHTTFFIALACGSFATCAWLHYAEEMDKLEKISYRDIASRLKWDIKEECMVPGARLPSIIQLTTRFHCSRGTIFRALKILEAEGLVESVHGRGIYVCAGADKGQRQDFPREMIITELNQALADKPSGTQIAHPQDIANQYGVSYMTVRRAILKMSVDGQLRRTRDGHYVKP